MLNGEYRTARRLRSLSRVVDARAMRNGLRPAHVDALHYFASEPPEQCTLGAYAESLGLDMDRASQHLTHLIETGYLRWSGPDVDHASLQLTARGREAARLDPMVAIAEAIAELPEDQRETFKSGLEEVFRRYLGSRD